MNGKRIVLLYCGDWDPSGECIERELKQRIVDAMQKIGSLLVDAEDIDMRRVAILKGDIRQFHLPPLRVKDKDSRSAKFVRRHGNRAVELDALPANELRDRLSSEIESVIDVDAWQRGAVIEEAQRVTCNRYARTLQNLRSAEDA